MQARKPFQATSEWTLATPSHQEITKQGAPCRDRAKTLCGNQRASRRWTSSIAVVSAIGLLCMTGGWLLIEAIAPAMVQAYTSRLSVALDVQPGETYETFLRRAEAVVGAAVQRSFDRDILISELSVVVVGQKGGAIAQILSLQASRTQWRSRPDPRRWATYYRSAAALLSFGEATARTKAPAAPVVTEQIAAPPQTTPQPTSSSEAVPSASVKPSPEASSAPLPFPTPDSPTQPPLRVRPGTTPLPPSR